MSHDLQETDDDHWPTDEIRALVALSAPTDWWAGFATEMATGINPADVQAERERERERMADLDCFDPHREQTDRYDRREDEDGYLR